MILLSGCAIIDDGRLLVLFKRSKQSYFLPGGKVEPDETLDQAAEREVLEETGCRVEFIQKLDDLIFTDGAEYCSTVFSAKITEGAPQLLEQDIFDHLMWLPIAEYERYSLSPPVRMFCENYVKGKYARAPRKSP